MQSAPHTVQSVTRRFTKRPGQTLQVLGPISMGLLQIFLGSACGIATYIRDGTRGVRFNQNLTK
jgi:hypothetical protein